MVAVRTKFLASLVAVALVASPLGLGATGAELQTIEPDCYPADDGSGAYICVFPDTCEEDLQDSCEVPPSCELVDEHTVRCEPDGTTDNTTDEEPTEGEPRLADLIQPPDDGPDETQLGQPMAQCGLDTDARELVCEPPPECQETETPDYCQPPEECQPAEEGLYRCVPGPGRSLPDQARENRGGEDRRQGNTSSESQEGPDCEPASERGVLVCTPPPECADRLGQSDACTPPPECEDLGDGTFRCEIPDRLSDGQGDTGGEDPFAEVDPEARTQARAEIAQGIRDAAESFRSELDGLRADYEQRLDDLRAEYQDRKNELRLEYQACREEIPSNATAEERNQALQACLQEAREDLASLRSDMRQRHDQLKASAQDSAEQVRQETCTEAENVALNAVADHGLFAANPADLVPQRALELCPGFADFDEGGELG